MHIHRHPRTRRPYYQWPNEAGWTWLSMVGLPLVLTILLWLGQ